jgi:alkylation response protein AidB-like acyl-CoA dehydrogenase
VPSIELRTLLERTREVAREVIGPNAPHVDHEGRWPEENLRALQAAGLGGLIIPQKLGGLGHGLLAVTQVCEIIGRYCASTALCIGMHYVGSAVLVAKATEEQAQSYLAPIAEGAHLTTLALSEPGSGSHFYIPQTELKRVSADLFHVTGSKTFVTNGAEADSYVVSVASADPEAPPGEFSCVVIPRGAEGITWGPQWQGAGMRGNAARAMELRAVPVPRQNLLGEEGDEIWYVFQVILPYFLVAMAGAYLGVATAALEETRAHLVTRQYEFSGTALAEQPVIQHRVGSLWGLVERTRRLVYFAAMEGDSGGSDALPALLSCKAEVADCVVEVTNEALTLTGGIAYRENSNLFRHLRDARAAPVMSPTTDLLRTWTGRVLLDQPLLGE